MNLRVYLAENEVTAKDFSEIIGYERTYISAIINGRKIPGRKLASEIEKWTGGKVKYNKTSPHETKSKQQKHKER